MDRSYFDDREDDGQRTVSNAPDDEGDAEGFFATMVDAIQQVGESG